VFGVCVCVFGVFVCVASLNTAITLSLRLLEARDGIWLVGLTCQYSVRPEIDTVTVHSASQIKIPIAETSYSKHAFISTTVMPL
jgi:hypothetical protein